PMASTTKIMTALVVLETPGLDLAKVVTIKQAYRDYVVANGYSNADLVPGDRLTVRQLLYAMLLPSGCDAAYALADTFGIGSTVSTRIKSFIAKMNNRATELGLSGTKFASFDGNSSAATHYSTPRSLAALAAVALANPTFAAMVATKSTTQTARTGSNGARSYTWTNSNRLLGSYSGALGVKTGTSNVAGYCLIFAARRNGVLVVGVVLGDVDDGSRYGDARRMLDWAYG
ncbi:MAG: D-alanyl-D-alanine carboxypeptidase family protein, partial [Marmoricola sp.]